MFKGTISRQDGQPIEICGYYLLKTKEDSIHLTSDVLRCVKMVQMNLFAGPEQRHRCREWTCGHGGKREGGTNWEIRIDIYTLPCVKQIASGNLLYSTGSSAWCSVMTQMGGMGGGGREVQEGRDICIHIADSLRCTAETSTTL